MPFFTMPQLKEIGLNGNEALGRSVRLRVCETSAKIGTYSSRHSKVNPYTQRGQLARLVNAFKIDAKIATLVVYVRYRT